MPALSLMRLQQETSSCKRVLGFLADENILLKNRLSEMLKDGLDTNLLNEMERFQNEFINGDVVIGVLRNDVAEFDRSISNFSLLYDTPDKDIQIRLNKIRNNISTAENQLRNLTIEFNRFATGKA